MSKNTGVLISP